MKKLLLSSISLLCFCVSFSQNKQYKIHTVAFYNLENLFDIYDDPNKMDEISPILEISSGRNSIYLQKLKNLSKVISEIGKTKTNTTPTFIGVAEVENKKVLEDLITTPLLATSNYGIIHYDSPDQRGIDVGFIYKKNKFIPISHQPYELKLWSTEGYRVHTRDQLLVSGYLENELIHIIVNHWPSRRGGEKKSRPLREKAALLTKRISDSIFETDPNSKILIMGDFNDDPTNTSFKKILLTKRHKTYLKTATLYNPYENLFLKGHNTLGYRDNINLFDQIILSESFISNNHKYDSLKLFKANIFNPKYLTNTTGRYKNYPFRSFQNGSFSNGYSDHYPVYIYLIKYRIFK
jgi:hypothetical protein